MSDKPKLIDRFKKSKFAEFVRDKVKPVAGDVLEIVGDITGVDAIERVGNLLNNRKEDNEQVRALAVEFEKYKMEWQLEIERIRVDHHMEEMRMESDDRKSAREMRMAMGKNDPLIWACAIYVMLASSVIIYAGLFMTLSQEQALIHARLEGFFLGSGLAALFAFVWGTTKSSQRKTEMLAGK